MKDNKRTPFEIYMDNQFKDWEENIDSKIRHELFELYLKLKKEELLYESVCAVTLIQNPLGILGSVAIFSINDELASINTELNAKINSIRGKVKSI